MRSYREERARVIEAFEKRYVGWLLARHRGNVSAAAREARMDRKHLHDLLSKHGMRRSRSNPPESTTLSPPSSVAPPTSETHAKGSYAGPESEDMGGERLVAEPHC